MKYSLLLNRCYGLYDQYRIKWGKSRPKKREIYCGEFVSEYSDPQVAGFRVLHQWLDKVGGSFNVFGFCVDSKARIVTLNIGGQYGWPKRVDTMKKPNEVGHADS